MGLIETLLSNKPKKSLVIAKKIAEELDINWDKEAKTVFSVIANDIDRAPRVGGKNDSSEDCIRKWLLKYRNGYEGRPSQRISKPLGTVADPIIEKMVEARLSGISDDELSKITFSHRLAMSAENILGLMLEEYLATNLAQSGWACAWGETVKSVDFVHSDGRLLQIKNRSNSENSSSSKVREGTSIKKWHRIDANTGNTNWENLAKTHLIVGLSETGFIDFSKKCLTENPACLAIDDRSPWKN